MLKQEQLIEKVEKSGADDPRVDAILMYGSFTQGCGDQYSDVEFYIFIRDDSFSAFDTGQWIGRIHPFFTRFHNEYGTEVAIFTNLIRGEFHFLPLSRLSDINGFTAAGYFPDVDSMILFDREGRLRQAVQVLRGCTLEFTGQDIDNLAGNLFNHLLYGVNVLKRGELARALECLQSAHRCLLQAIRLLEDQTNHFINPAKNLENEISPQWYRAFAACTSNVSQANLYSAYRHLAENCRTVAGRLTQKYAIGDYHALADQIISYLNE